MYGVAMFVGCRTVVFHRLYVMRDDNPAELVPQQSPGGNLKSLFFLLLNMFLYDYFIFVIFRRFLKMAKSDS